MRTFLSRVASVTALSILVLTISFNATRAFGEMDLAALTASDLFSAFSVVVVVDSDKCDWDGNCSEVGTNCRGTNECKYYSLNDKLQRYACACVAKVNPPRQDHVTPAGRR